MEHFPKIPRAALTELTMPILVVTGSEDHDNGSARALAAILQNAAYVEVPGNHMSAVTLPELGNATAEWF